MKRKIKSYLKRIYKLINLQEMKILPGHLAFNIVMMIVPIFSIIGVLGSSINIKDLLSSLQYNVPNAVLTIIESALNISSNEFNLILFIIFGLWLVSGGCRAIITSSDILYKVKDKSTIKKYLKSFLMVIILFLLIGFIIIVPVLGDLIINFLNKYIKAVGLMNLISNIYHLLKYPITIILMFFLIKVLYTLAPSINVKSNFMTPGAWFTTISWFILTRIYSFHLNNYSNYNLYYGSLSNILILLVWVYLLAYLFTIGLALNADNYLTSLKDKEY